MCETWRNTDAANIVSSFQKIHKWQPLINQAITTLYDIQPINTNEKERIPKALSDIGICILAICNYGNADVIIKETIDDINDRFFKISKEINSACDDISHIKSSLDQISKYYELHAFDAAINKKVNLKTIMANKYFQSINQIFNFVDLGMVNHQILNALQLNDIEKTSNKMLSRQYKSMEITALSKHNNYVLIIYILMKSYFSKADLYKVFSFPALVDGVCMRATQRINFFLENSIKATT